MSDSNGEIRQQAIDLLYEKTGTQREEMPGDAEVLRRDLTAARDVAFQALAREAAARDHNDRLERLLASTLQQHRKRENSFVQYRDNVLHETNLHFRTAAEISRETVPETKWRIDDLLPSIALVMVAGVAKGAGKTTLMLHIIRAILRDAMFLGRSADSCPVVYLVEQPPVNFYNDYLAPVGIHDSEDLHLLYAYEASGVPWPVLVTKTVAYCVKVGAGVLCIDTFLRFAGLSEGQENDSAVIQAALRPLQDAVAAHNLLIIIIHHDKKGGSPDVYTSGRGSSGFQGVVDQIYNLQRPPGNHAPNLREIRSIGRYDVPESLMIELVDGEYQARGTARDVAFQEATSFALESAPTEEAGAWDTKTFFGASKDEGVAISKRTLQNALASLVNSGALLCLGNGVRGDPYRYYRPP